MVNDDRKKNRGFSLFYKNRKREIFQFCFTGNVLVEADNIIGTMLCLAILSSVIFPVSYLIFRFIESVL